MELLAPAGSFEAAKAAVAAGADAVYMGGPLFSARAYAESSKEGGDPDIVPGDPLKDPLLRTIRYCHLNGVRVYMTLNTLMKEGELLLLEAYLKPYAESRVDAFIVQDLGLLSWLRQRFPEIPVHISTQAAVTGPRYARKLMDYGAARAVPARELDLKEIRAIADTGIEVEAFIHGALCYSYSGQCLMSSFIGCRSGNRGRCAGTCRLPYEVYDRHLVRVGEEDEKYPLCMRDLCTLERLDELEEAGVCSLKIEGRMKSPLYVAGVTSIYRKWLDRKRRIDGGFSKEEKHRLKEDICRLKEIFDRGGFTDAYLDGKNGRDSIALPEREEMRIPDTRVVEEIRSEYLSAEKKIPVCVTGIFRKDKEAELVLATEDGRYRICCKGQTVQKAGGRPVTEEEIREKTLAFGNTSFEPVSVEFQIDDDVFFPVGKLKELRRRACEKLEKSILEGFGGNS